MQALLIDGLNLVRRVHAAVRLPHNREGDERAQVEEALKSLRRSLGRALRFHRPTHAVCAWESDTPGWRHEKFTGYKKNRKPMPTMLRESLPRFADMMSAMGIASLGVEGSEADDVIATLAAGIARHGGHSVILSTDNLFCQLLNEGITVYDHFGKRFLDYEYVVKKYGVAPTLLRDFFALTGVPSLNIPGAAGIGAVNARELLNHYGSLEELFAAADDEGEDIPEKLSAGKEGALLAQELAGLRTDVKLGVNLKDLQYTHVRPERRPPAAWENRTPSEQDEPPLYDFE